MTVVVKRLKCLQVTVSTPCYFTSSVSMLLTHGFAHISRQYNLVLVTASDDILSQSNELLSNNTELISAPL